MNMLSKVFGVIAWALAIGYGFGLLLLGPVPNIVMLGFVALLYSAILNRFSLNEAGYNLTEGRRAYLFRVFSYGNYINSRICQIVVFGITIFYVLAHHVRALFGG